MAVYFSNEKDPWEKRHNWDQTMQNMISLGNMITNMQDETNRRAEVLKGLGRQDESYKQLGVRNTVKDMVDDAKNAGRKQSPGIIDTIKGMFSSSPSTASSPESTFREDPTIASLAGSNAARGYISNVGKGATDAFLGEQVGVVNPLLEAQKGGYGLTQAGYDLPTGLGRTADWQRSMREPQVSNQQRISENHAAIQAMSPQAGSPQNQDNDSRFRGALGQEITGDPVRDDINTLNAYNARKRQLGPVTASNIMAHKENLMTAMKDTYTYVDRGREGNGMAGQNPKYMKDMAELDKLKFGGTGSGPQTYYMRNMDGVIIGQQEANSPTSAAVLFSQKTGINPNRLIGSTKPPTAADIVPGQKYSGNIDPSNPNVGQDDYMLAQGKIKGSVPRSQVVADFGPGFIQDWNRKPGYVSKEKDTASEIERLKRKKK